MLGRRHDDSRARGAACTDVEALASRIDTLAAIVRETSGALAATRGEVAATGRRLEERLRGDTARMDEALTRARDEIVALRRQSRDASTADHPADDREVLARRLESLSAIVGETAGKLAAGEGVLTALSATIAGESTRVDEALAELRHELTALHNRSEATRDRPGSPPVAAPVARRIDALREKPISRVETQVEQQLADAHELVTALTRELDSVRGLVDDASVVGQADRLAGAAQILDNRLDAIARIVSTTADGIATHVELVPALERRLDELGERVDAVVLEVRRGRRTLALNVATARSAAHLELKLAPLAGALAELTDSVEETASAAARVGADVREALEQRLETVAHEPTRVLEELASKLEHIEVERRERAIDLATAEAAWERERSELQAQLETIAGATLASPSGADGERLVLELAVRLDRLEREHDSVSELAALADGWTTSLAALAARVDHGLRRIDDSAPAEVEAETQELADVAARVAAIEADRETVVEQLARATRTWSAERVALQERVAELAARIVTGPIERPEPGDSGEGHVASLELDRMRIGLEGIRMRLAYHEKHVSEIRAKSIVERLDELGAQVAHLQQAVVSGEGAPIAWTNSIPLPTVDYGGLLNRVEQAERVARTGHDDLLQHLERLASRMDWRLQRLETTDSELVPVLSATSESAGADSDGG